MDRDELINICYRSIVPYTEWNNRDSFVAQLNVNEAYGLLSVGAEYTVSLENDHIIWLRFENLTPELIRESHWHNLDYDSIDDYRELYPDDEIFEYYSSVDVDETSTSCYLPTMSRLEKTEATDWY